MMDPKELVPGMLVHVQREHFTLLSSAGSGRRLSGTRIAGRGPQLALIISVDWTRIEREAIVGLFLCATQVFGFGWSTDVGEISTPV